MKTPFAFLILVTLVSSQHAAQPPKGDVLIDFRYYPSFSRSLVVLLGPPNWKSSRAGASVYSLPSREDMAVSRSKDEVLLSEATFEENVYDEIVATFEDPVFRDAAERTPVGGADGSSWEFRMRCGSRQLAYIFWTPEARPEVASSAMAIALARRIVSVAGWDPDFYMKKVPNKAPEPTTTAVTPRATERKSK